MLLHRQFETAHLKQIIQTENVNDITTVMQLLQRGADPNIRDDMGRTFLYVLTKSFLQKGMGIFTKHRTFDDLIMIYQSKVNIPDDNGQTPLDLVMEKLSSAINTQERKIFADSAMYLIKFIARDVSEAESLIKAKQLLKLMVQQNADGKLNSFIKELTNTFAIPNTEKYTVKLISYINGDWKFSLDKVRNLIKKGANIHAPGRDGKTLLHLLAEHPQKGCEALIDYLISEKKMQVDITDDHGVTPLQTLLNLYHTSFDHLADFFNIAMVLVRLNADVNQKSRHNHTLLDLLHIINREGHAYEYINELTEVHGALVNHDFSPIRCLIDGHWYFDGKKALAVVREGASSNTRGHEGKTILHLLCANPGSSKDASIIDELYQNYGMVVDIADDNGKTPTYYLISAIKHTKLDPLTLVKFKYGARVNQVGSNGDTLLHALIKHNEHGQFTAAIKTLILTYEADVNITDHAKNTPLESLCALSKNADKNNLELLKLLLNAGARYNPVLKTALVANNKIFALNIIKQHEATLRTNFLNFLFFLAIHLPKAPQNSLDKASFFQALPMEIIYHIFSLFDYAALDRGHRQGLALAIATTAPENQALMKEKLNEKHPGGVNVFVSFNPVYANYELTFFKSCKQFMADYKQLKEKLLEEDKHKLTWKDKSRMRKLTESSIDQLDTFKNDFAILCWNEHKLRYHDPVKRKKFLTKLQKQEPYNDKEIKKKMSL